MVTDPDEVRRLGAEKAAENVEFRRHLAAHHHPVDDFRILASEYQQHFDCTQCANCCRYSIVAVSAEEIGAIGRYLGSSEEDTTREYTEPGEEGRILKSTEAGCVFLDGTLCMVYEARPKVCHDFPHVALSQRSLGGRFSSLGRWAALCPILYNALEAYKHVVGYHPHARAAHPE